MINENVKIIVIDGAETTKLLNREEVEPAWLPVIEQIRIGLSSYATHKKKVSPQAWLNALPAARDYYKKMSANAPIQLKR